VKKVERIRAYYDADHEEKVMPTTYKTNQNRNEMFCSMCGGTVFVDDYIFRDVCKAMEQTNENPFLCEPCLTEYEEMAYRH
jgi:hypothetical protein